MKRQAKSILAMILAALMIVLTVACAKDVAKPDDTTAGGSVTTSDNKPESPDTGAPKVSVTIGDVTDSYEIGSKLPRPEDPTKEPTDTIVYVFEKWVIAGTDTAWDFDRDVVKGELKLEAVFSERERKYNPSYRIFGDKKSLVGKEYGLFDIPDAEVRVTVKQGETVIASPEVKNSAFSFEVPFGSYEVTVTYKEDTVTLPCDLKRTEPTDVVFTKAIQLGGQAGEFKSFGSGHTVTGSRLDITGVTYAYIGGEETTDTLYMEANVAFTGGVGKMVGFMVADHGNLTGSGVKKLVFSYSAGNKLYYQLTDGWNGTGITQLVPVDPEFAPLTGCKLGLARKGSDYYLFVNDKLIAHYQSDAIGAGDFGFCSTNGSGVTISFSDVVYTVSDAVVSDIIDRTNAKDKLENKNTYVGGSFTYPGGNTHNSFKSGWTLNGFDSGKLSATTYLFATGAVGNVYYQEAEFSKENGWVGFLVNTLDGQPQTNKGWYGYGVLGGTLYLHEFSTSWSSGTSKGYFGVGDGDTFKLGIARINDQYYVFINGVLVLQEKVTAYSTADNTLALPADNMSGFGIFRGGNHSDEGKKISFTNYRYTTDIHEIFDMIGGEATLEFGDGITAEQPGLPLKSGDKLLPGAYTTIRFDVPDGKAVKKYTVTLDGVTVKADLSGNAITFQAAASGKYAVTVEFADVGTAKVNLTVKPVERTANGKTYPLYGMNVDWSQVTVSLRNLATGAEIPVTLESGTKTIADIPTGYYLISVTCNSNLYTGYLSLDKDRTADYTGYVSPVYLGGTITIPNADGESTTYKSYSEVSPDATSGNAWALVNGRRDTVLLTKYTYAFQNQFSGTRYYVEGTFDATVQINPGVNFAGLLIAHGPNSLSGNSEKKFEVTISGRSVLGTYLPESWSPVNTFVIANFADMNISYDPTAVRLGVVRDGIRYWFFVNDVYVGYYVLPEITNECGVGVAGNNNIHLIVSNFNYSANDELIEAYKAMSPSQEKKKIDVYLIAGQSNASGCTNVNWSSAVSLNPNYLYGFNNIFYAGNAGANWKNHISFGLARTGLGESSGKMGAEIGMAEALSEYYNNESGRQAVIIKYAVGGTSLQDYVGGLNASDGNWCPPSYFKNHNRKDSELSGGLYTKFFEEFDRQWATLKAMGYEPTIKGLYWMQGESDRGSEDLYIELFKMLIADMRSDLTAHSGQDCSQMPVFVGEISRTCQSADESTMEKNRTFIQMQRELPNYVSNVYIVANSQFDINALDTKGNNYAVGSDSWHWNWKDALKIGNLVGKSILENALKQK